MLDEVPDFTISLSDESDDGHICRIVSCHGSQQRALSHSAAAEDADTLSETAGKETVDGPNPGRQRLLDMLALHRPRGFGKQVVTFGPAKWRTSVYGLSEPVENTT